MSKQDEMTMKPEEFKKVHLLSGKVQYEHIESGNRRIKIISDFREGKITMSDFQEEQRKMRGGKYLKCLYSEPQYLKAIGNTES